QRRQLSPRELGDLSVSVRELQLRFELQSKEMERIKKQVASLGPEASPGLEALPGPVASAGLKASP
ncbi:unnamed protein product, partial [Lampetra fluviatilis]